MIENGNFFAQFSRMQRALMSSLRLKDVLDTAVLKISEIAGFAKVAIFLADNESMSFRLMAAKGYSARSIYEMRLIPFAAASALKDVFQRRAHVAYAELADAPSLSANLMDWESSKGHIGLPLIAYDLIVGAMLIDLSDSRLLSRFDFLNDVADAVAVCVANAIIFGRSEYERERLRTLYKSLCALSSNALRTPDVLRIACDTALVLGNTPNCALLLYDSAKNAFHLAAFKGLDGSSMSEFDLSGKHTIAGTTLATGRSEYIGDGSREPHGLPRATGGSVFASVLALPIIYEGKPLGVLEVFSIERKGFEPEQIELLESFSRQVSTALHVSFTHESSVMQSIQDAHTGLYNRNYFEEALDKEMERSHRHNHELGLLLIDLDQLGKVNEQLGEQNGDEAIRHVAKTIKESLRDIDMACRWGGEEFAVILPETTLSAALEVAERLRNRIRSSTVKGVGLITASIGVSVFPTVSEEVTPLVQAAAEALAVAKYQGRDRVIFAPDANAIEHDRLIWADLVREATLAVTNERQAQIKSRLMVAPEYAALLTENPVKLEKVILAKGKTAD